MTAESSPAYPAPRLLAELTFREAQRAAAAGAVVLLPIGATEAHGPHLPLGTDVYLSEEVARRAARALAAAATPALIAPSLAYAVTEFGADFAGTVSLDSETAHGLYVGVLRGLLRTGFRKLCVVNSHLEPAHIEVLRAACAEVERLTGTRVAFPDQAARRWARTLSDEYKRGNCHAGRYETALVLASRPELCHEDIRRDLAENPADFLSAVRSGAATFPQAGGPEAYFGAPAAATTSEGEDLYRLLVTMTLTTIGETFP